MIKRKRGGQRKLEHGPDCKCQKCDRSAWHKQYYKDNKEWIVVSKKARYRKGSKYGRKKVDDARKMNGLILIEKYGEDYFKTIGSKGGVKTVALFPKAHYTQWGKRGAKVNSPEKRQGISILDKIDKLINK